MTHAGMYDPLKDRIVSLGSLHIDGDDWREPLQLGSAAHRAALPQLSDAVKKLACKKPVGEENRRRLCDTVGIPDRTAPASKKADVVTKGGEDGGVGAYNVENTACGHSSWVNASQLTRVTQSIVRKDGSALTDNDKSFLLINFGGHVDGRGKKRAQAISNLGFDFEYHPIKSQAFAEAIERVGAVNMAKFVRTYLLGNKASLRAILGLDPGGPGMQLLGYARDTILLNSPTQCPRLFGSYGEYTKSGVMLLLPNEKKQERQIAVYQATSPYWWEPHILRGGAFSGADTDDHRGNWGYAYEEDGRILFDYALNIRGSFGHLAR